MRFEDGINLVIGSNLLAEQHTTTRLIDDTISQVAEVLDLPAQFLDLAMWVNTSLPRIVRVLAHASPARAFPTTSPAISMSTRYVRACCS
jgi:hypothetical protein